MPLRVSPTEEEKSIGPGGPEGPAGPKGATGEPGPGMPAGGAANEIVEWKEAGVGKWSKNITLEFLTVTSIAFIKVIKELTLLEVLGVITGRRFQAIKEAAREIGAGPIAITTAEDCFLNIKATEEGAEITRIQFASAQPKIGELLFIWNNSANKLTIIHETAEAGTGKFALVGLANFVMAPKAVKQFIYTGSWRDFS